MKLKLLLLYILLTTHCGLTTATIRYVSKTGSSTPPYTSWATAADSIQKCINICQAGDTIYVANGVYKETLIINKEIALLGSSMDSTVIDGTGLRDTTIYTTEICSIENFNVYGKGAYLITRAIYSQESTRLRNLRITNTGAGVSVRKSSSVENIIMNKLLRGFNVGCSAGLCEQMIKGCVIHLDRSIPYSDATGIDLGGEATFYIENNIITSTAGSSTIGISISWINRAFIRNNLISGFYTNIYFDRITDTTYVENVISTNSPDPYGSIYLRNIKMVVRNNIFTNNRVGLRIYSTPYYNYNNYWNNKKNINGAPTINDSDIVADPMFVNDTIPTANSNYDYHLQAFSPAIDKGDPNLIDVDGTRSDMGMYGGPFGEITYYKDLAPQPPRNLSVIVDTNKVTIKWKRNTEADTSYYKVYRDTVQNFTIDSTKLIGSPTDTFYVHSPLPIGRYYYKVSCVDKQGNESRASEEVTVNLTSINDYPMTINDYFLYQNYPNPFNPSTTIGYKLKERGYVKLMVYDIKGELVSVLVNQEQEAGYYEVEFSVSSIQHQASSIQNLASGIYLYRIEVIGEGNILVYTEMKKMLVIK